MAPILQPDLHPWPLWLKRIALVLALALAVLVTGLCFGTARRPPPVLLLSGAGHEMAYARAVERLVSAARSRVFLVMFVIREDGDGPVGLVMQALAAAAARGVQVQVVLDRGVDRVTGQPDAKHEDAAAWLKAHGIQVVIDESDITTHAKTLVVDGRWCVVGSHNWTRSAFTTNREASLLIDDTGLAKQLEMWFATIPGWKTR
jgi:phosphatidylserine/phosphatidylglycerophosphate/cardiolipin synthase-like enzyme